MALLQGVAGGAHLPPYRMVTQEKKADHLPKALLCSPTRPEEVSQAGALGKSI